jgi:hypothetical protein
MATLEAVALPQSQGCYITFSYRANLEEQSNSDALAGFYCGHSRVACYRTLESRATVNLVFRVAAFVRR